MAAEPNYDENVVTDKKKRALITAAVMLATIMQAIDTTIANVALPHMQGSMGVFQDQISWVLTSYILASAIFIPLTSFLVSRIGQKRLFLWSVVGFTATSMLCGAAQDIYQIVGFRFLQGVFGAPLVPLSQAIMLDTYPRRQHGSAMAMWGMGVMLGPIIGPTLGGWLTEYYSWRAVFYINLPIGILTWFGLFIFLRETPIDKKRRFDLMGFAFLSISIAGLQMMLDRGESLNWFASTEVIIECFVAVLFMYFFVVHIFTVKDPFIDPKLFKDRNFSAGMLFMFLIGIILLAVLALLPPFMQNLMGYPIIDIGNLLAPRGAGTMISMMIVGRLVEKTDPRYFVFIGLLLIAFSLRQMSLFTHEVSGATIVMSGFIQGVGLGCIFVPLSTLTFATLGPRVRMEATPLYNLIRNLGSSLGVSIVITLLSQNAQLNHESLSSFIEPNNLALRQLMENSPMNFEGEAGLFLINNLVTQQSVLLAYLQDFRFMMWLTLCSIPLLFLLKVPELEAEPDSDSKSEPEPQPQPEPLSNTNSAPDAEKSPA